MKKKLLILIDTMKPMIDGVSIFLNYTLPYLTDKYDVTIIATDYSNETYENAKLIKFPRIFSNITGYGPVFVNRRIIKKEVKKCDYVLNHESVSPIAASFFALKYAKKYNKPFFTYVHSIDWELFPETISIPKFIRNLAKDISKIIICWYLRIENNIKIVSLPFLKNKLEDVGVTGDYEIIPIGISDYFKPVKVKKNFKNKIVIAYSGRVSREKGMDILLSGGFISRSQKSPVFILIQRGYRIT